MLHCHTTGGGQQLPPRWCGAVPANNNSPLCRKCRVSPAVCLSSSSDDLYDVLSVPATASLAEIKAAYRRLVHELHPDKHAHKHTRQSAAMADAFLQCKLAYEVLSDPQQRRSYDEGRAPAGGQQGPTASSSQPWSPYYNGWMGAYGTTAHNPADSSSGSQGTWGSGQEEGAAAAAATDCHQAMQQAAAATAAAGACHSGLSHSADPLAAALGSSGDDDSMLGTTNREQQQQQTSAAVRAALLQEHGLALEQFGSLQDAVAALSERDQQQTLVGLAEGDYDNTWTL